MTMVTKLTHKDHISNRKLNKLKQVYRQRTTDILDSKLTPTRGKDVDNKK